MAFSVRLKRLLAEIGENPAPYGMHSLPVRRAEPSARGLKGCRPLGCRVCHDQRLLAEARGAEDALVCRSTREPPPHVHRQGRGILAPDRGVRSLRDAARFPMKKPRGNGWSWRGATSRNQAGRCRTGKKPSTASLFRGRRASPGRLGHQRGNVSKPVYTNYLTLPCQKFLTHLDTFHAPLSAQRERGAIAADGDLDLCQSGGFRGRGR